MRTTSARTSKGEVGPPCSTVRSAKRGRSLLYLPCEANKLPLAVESINVIYWVCIIGFDKEMPSKKGMLRDAIPVNGDCDRECVLLQHHIAIPCRRHVAILSHCDIVVYQPSSAQRSDSDVLVLGQRRSHDGTRIQGFRSLKGWHRKAWKVCEQVIP